LANTIQCSFELNLDEEGVLVIAQVLELLQDFVVVALRAHEFDSDFINEI